MSMSAGSPYAGAVGPLAGAAGSIVGGLLGSPGSTSSTSGTQNVTGSTSQEGSAGQTGQTTTTGQQQGVSTSTPDLPGWYSNFLKQLPGQYNSLFGQSQKPVYGAPQIAQYKQGLDQNYGAAQQSALSQLARMGALNSGRAASVLTNLQGQKANQFGQFQAQVPFQNAQFSQQFGGNLLGQGMGFKPPYGQTTTSAQTSLSDVLNSLNSFFNNQGNTNQTTTSNQTTKQGGTGLFGKLLG